jgi:hypothetical protein
MTQDEVLKLFVQLLSSPEVQQMLAASMQQQGAGMGGMCWAVLAGLVGFCQGYWDCWVAASAKG